MEKENRRIARSIGSHGRFAFQSLSVEIGIKMLSSVNNLIIHLPKKLCDASLYDASLFY